MIRLGDGTEESHARMHAAHDQLWPYVGELFERDEIDDAAVAAGIGPDPANIETAYRARITEMMAKATLTIPESGFAHRGGRTGFRHSEHLGHMLTQMQWLQRAYPGATW